MPRFILQGDEDRGTQRAGFAFLGRLAEAIVAERRDQQVGQAQPRATSASFTDSARCHGRRLISFGEANSSN